jgi:hypothetical protein
MSNDFPQAPSQTICIVLNIRRCPKSTCHHWSFFSASVISAVFDHQRSPVLPLFAKPASLPDLAEATPP